MKIVKVKQKSKEWLHYRCSHICASDSGIILGTCKFKSIHKLYEEKTKQYESVPNQWMLRGIELEKIALEEFERETGLTMFPFVGEHAELNWMAASFDGMTIEGDVIVEIKAPGQKDHELALSGKVPEKYLAQLNHQMHVAGIDYAFYFSFDGSKGKILEVKRDQHFIDEMLEKEFEFWQCLQTLTPPENKRRKRNAATTSV